MPRTALAAALLPDRLDRGTGASMQNARSGSGEPYAAQHIGRHAHELDVNLTPGQCDQLEHFVRLLLRWNRIHNLTAITGGDEILSHHLLDSLSLVNELRSPAPLRILDAGTGAGLPGIPLAVAMPEHRFTLIDAVAKKCAFMTQARLELALSNVDILHRRVEQLHGAHFDVIVSRALGSLASFTSLTRHLLAPAGRWIAMKGVVPEDELQQLPADVALTRTVT